MLNRRQFLTISGLFALTGTLGSCGRSSAASLQIDTLKGSIAPQLLALFRQRSPVSLNLTPREQLQELFEELQALPTDGTARKNWLGQTQPIPDLVTLGHGWYRQAIATGLIQPLPLTQLESWRNLGEPWQTFLGRDDQGLPTENAQIWGQPYRWGTTLLVYRKDKFRSLDWTPTDWSDLWRPELQGKFSLLDHSREVLGFILKKQGRSYNETDPQAIANLAEDFQALHRNAKFYSSTHYLQPLDMGDIWLAQGWSQDILPLLKQDRNLGAVVPASGTAIWCDLWVQPRGSEQTFSALQPWLDFCWQPEAIQQISRSSYGASPLIYSAPDLDPQILANPLIYLNQQIFQASELIDTLDPETTAQYQALWRKVRLG
jgi:putative spermidine/putrescine transport system substrate-binding protein